MATTNFVDGQTVVEASWLNDVDEVVYETVLKKDGTVTATADIPMGGFTLTNVADAATTGEPVTYNQAAVKFPSLGIGTDASSWDTSTYRALDLSTVGSVAAATAQTVFAHNSYYASSNWKAKTTATGGLLYLSGSGLTYYSLASVTAGNNQTPVERLTVTEDGRIYGTALHNNANAVTGTTNQYIASGTYTPVSSSATNTSNITFYAATWIRVGNVVVVSGLVDVDAVAAAATSFEATLPIASNFTSAIDAAGTAGADTAENAMRIYASAANDKVVFSGISAVIAVQTFGYTFSYLIR